jgi:hypothetical protein
MERFDAGPGGVRLAAELAAVEAGLAELEAALAQTHAPSLRELVERASALLVRLFSAYVVQEGAKPVPPPQAGLLESFGALRRGDPSWNAIRDNCRELVYYLNCINMGRQDALPAHPERMALRTARHVYLYVRTRCIREGWVRD